MLSRPKKILILIIVAGSCTGTFLGLFYLFSHLPFQPPPYEHVQMNRFPLPLDQLFMTDLPANRTNRLNQIATGQTGGYIPFIDPYPNYFTGAHSPAAFKWYLNALRNLPISLSCDAYMTMCTSPDETTTTINGETCHQDVGLDLQISYYIHVGFGHMYLNESLYSAFNSAQSVDVFGKNLQAIFLPANTVIGFSSVLGGPDFIIYDMYYTHPNMQRFTNWHSHGQNPLYYFTPDVQTEILNLYDAQYDAMKSSGKYVEGALDRQYDLNEASTFFGTWFYKSGWFSLNASHHQICGWYSFDASSLDIIDVNKTDHATFYKDTVKGTNFGSDMIGVFYDARYVEVQGYVPIGGKYMYYIEGNNASGIVRLDNFLNNIRVGTIYMKYELHENIPADMLDDTLQVEYFTTLLDAQGDFTSQVLCYVRSLEDSS